MEILGVLEDFPTPRVGGFGSDFCSMDTSNMTADRAELIRIARRRAEEAYGEIGAHVHVGDTPYDLGAAKLVAGVRALGVATGRYSTAELEPHLGEGQVLQDLCDLPGVLHAFGLEEPGQFEPHRLDCRQEGSERPQVYPRREAHCDASTR